MLFKIPYNETGSKVPKDWIREIRCPLNNLLATGLPTCFAYVKRETHYSQPTIIIIISFYSGFIMW